MTTTAFDAQMEQVVAGRPLPAAELEQLAASPDILPLGMLADEARRRTHGTRVTYVRVALCALDTPIAGQAPSAAREVRLTGAPATLETAVTAVKAARAAAGDRIVSGFAWPDVERAAAASGVEVARALAQLKAAGLDGLAELPLDEGGIEAAVIALQAAGYRRLRLTVRSAPTAARQALFERANQLQQRFGCIEALNPLPVTLDSFRPTTGYEDVKAVALARLAAPAIPTIQVDWTRYGPKLAQVALTFGANDLDTVGVSDESPDGRRRAPLEDVRRNIEAAGFTPAERDGAFSTV